MAKQISKGQALGGFNSDLDESIAKIGALDTAIHALDSTLKVLQADAGKLRKEIGGIDVSNVKGIKELNAKQQEANKIKVDAIKLEQQQQKLYEKFESERLKQIQKTSDAEAKAHAKREAQYNKEIQNANKAGASYQRESHALNELRNRYKDLAVQKMNGVKLTKEEQREYRALIPQIRQTDEALKKIDASGGQFQRNVGNYPKVINGFRNALGQLGVAFGVFQLAGAGGKALLDFENSVASFRTIVSDLDDVQFDKFKKEITSTADVTKRSNTEIAQSFEAIAGLNSEFAKTSEGLGEVSEAVSTLSKASGDELATSASSLVGIMNQFDLSANEANRAINVLAAGQAVGASSITQSAEAYKNFGAVAKGANITLEESQALIQVLGKNTIFGAEAGTKLRGVTLQLQKAQLGYASGVFNINDALAEYNEKLAKKTTAASKDAYATKIFGAENITAGKIVSSNIPLFEKFTAAVTDTSEAQKAAEINSNTLTNRWEEFKNVLENSITSSTSTNGALGGLKDTLKFLTDNIDGVIQTVKMLITTFVVFKATMMSLKLYDQFKSWRDLGGSIKGVAGNLTEAQKGAKAFGTAVNSIGFAVIIEMLIQVAKAWFDVASGANQARWRTEQFNKATTSGTEQAVAWLEKLNKAEKKALDNIELRLSKGQISEKEAIKLRQQAIGQTQKIITQEKTRLQAEKALLQLQLGSARAKRDRVKEDFSFAGSSIGDAGELNKAEKAVTDLLALEKRNTAEIIELNKALINGSQAQHDLTIQTNQLTDATGKETKAVKEKTKAYKDANDQIERMVSLQKETQDLTDEVALYEAGEDVDSAIKSQLEAIEQSGQYSLDLVKEKIQAEYDLRRAIIERQNIEAIDNATNEQEVINARIRRDFEIGKLDEEFLIKRKEVNKQLEDAQEAHAEKTTEKTIEASKKNYEDERKYIELTTKFWEDQIDKRIAKLNELTEASKKEQERIQGLAESGNVKAEQSIAREAEIQREAQKEIEKLEQRKKYIQLLGTFLQSYSNYLAEKNEDGTPKYNGVQALAKAGLDKASVEAFISAIPAFFDGADKLNANGSGIDGRGGFLAINHPDERVVPKKENDQLTMNGKPIPNDMLPSIVNQWKAGISLNSMSVKEVENSTDQQILKKLDQLNSTIKSQPDRYPEFKKTLEGVFELYFTEKTGNTTRRSINQYRKRS